MARWASSPQRWYDTRGPIAANMSKDPEAKWIPLPYPTGPDGLKGVEGKDIIRGYNVIPAESESDRSD